MQFHDYGDGHRLVLPTVLPRRQTPAAYGLKSNYRMQFHDYGDGQRLVLPTVLPRRQTPAAYGLARFPTEAMT